MPSKYWTPARVARLIDLHAQGLSATKIADALGGGVSRSAVQGKLRRMSAQARRHRGRQGALRLVTDPSRSADGMQRATDDVVTRARGAGRGRRRLGPKQVGASTARKRPQPLRVVHSAESKINQPAIRRQFRTHGIEAEVFADLTPLTVMMIDDHCDIWFANKLARKMFSIKSMGAAATDAVDDPDFRHSVEGALRDRHVRNVRFPKRQKPGRKFQARICPLKPKGAGAAVFIQEVGGVW